MDELLREFRTNTEYHEKVVEHLLKKQVPLSQAYLFHQPQTWEILSEAIELGKYKFDVLTEGYIDKRNGKPMSYQEASNRNFEDVRKIYIMSPMDRAVVHMLYLIYYGRLEKQFSKFCVSYRKGMSTTKVSKSLKGKIIRKHFPSGWKLDIHHYFDDVNLQTVEGLLKSFSVGSALDDLLWQLYHDDRVEVNGEVIHRYRGLIQGCAFACLLANLALKDIDEEISKLRVIYYRYSDDIIVLGEDADLALDIIQKMLASKGLIIHPKKKQRITSNDWFEFLGFKFKKDKVSVSSKTLHNVEHEIKTRTLSIVREQKHGADEEQIRSMVRSLQRYFFTAYAEDSKKFGMGVYLFGSMNVLHDLREIDFYCRDCLRACYTNKTEIYGLGSVDDREYYAVTHGNGTNVAENRRKTQKGGEDLIRDCGWVSLIHMYKCYHTNKELFEYEVNKLRL